MKQKIFMMITLLLFAVSFAGCEKDSPELANNFEISSDGAEYDSATNTVNFKGNRQTINITVATDNATGKWDARCPTDDLWCTYRKEKNQLIVTVAENSTDNERESYIKVILGDKESVINIRQDYIRKLRFASDILRIGSPRGSYQIGITTNIVADNLTFKVLDEAGAPVADDFWLKCGEFKDGTLSFIVTKNFSESTDRVATILASGDDTSAEFTLTQNMSFGKPYIIDISAIDYKFPNSYVYEIWYGNEKVGNICREYLYKLSPTSNDVLIKQVAVVAYPIVRGKIEHSNGLVLATLNEEKDATGKIIAVNAIPNGGNVMWNSSINPTTSGRDMLVSFNNGSASSLPTTIYLATGATGFNLTGLDEDDLPLAHNATIKPWVITDHREGVEITDRRTFDEFTYRVVKVGSQYWLADNLKTTRFRDGTPIPSNNWTEASTISGPVCASAGYANNTGAGYSSANANVVSKPDAIEVRNTTGPVYNFFAIFGKNATMSDATRAYAGPTTDGISPAGWGVPKVSEFRMLYEYIAQSAKAGEVYPCNELVTYSSDKETNATNITGFGAQGYRYRSATGTNSSNGTHYATIDGYSFSGVAGSGTASQHNTTAFCCGKETSTSFRESEVRWGIYVRCIQRD